MRVRDFVLSNPNRKKFPTGGQNGYSGAAEIIELGCGLRGEYLFTSSIPRIKCFVVYLFVGAAAWDGMDSGDSGQNLEVMAGLFMKLDCSLTLNCCCVDGELELRMQIWTNGLMKTTIEKLSFKLP